MREFEFTIDHSLRYDDSVDAMFELLDQFEERDDFDDIEWDEDEEIAYLENDDIEIEIALDDGFLEVYVNIHSDLDPRDIEDELHSDIGQFFETGRSRRPRRRERPRRSNASAPPQRSSREETSERSGGRRRRRKSGGGSSESGGSRWAPEETPEQARAKEEANKPVKAAEEAKPEEAKKGGFPWLWVIIILAALGGAYFFFVK